MILLLLNTLFAAPPTSTSCPVGLDATPTLRCTNPTDTECFVPCMPISRPTRSMLNWGSTQRVYMWNPTQDTAFLVGFGVVPPLVGMASWRSQQRNVALPGSLWTSDPLDPLWATLAAGATLAPLGKWSLRKNPMSDGQGFKRYTRRVSVMAECALVTTGLGAGLGALAGNLKRTGPHVLYEQTALRGAIAQSFCLTGTTMLTSRRGWKGGTARRMYHLVPAVFSAALVTLEHSPLNNGNQGWRPLPASVLLQEAIAPAFIGLFWPHIRRLTIKHPVPLFGNRRRHTNIPPPLTGAP